jgi:TraX protein
VIRNRAIGSVMVIMSPTKRGAATLGAHTTDTSAGWGNLFVGAPLDFVKLVAAIAMTGGHINASLYLLLWRLDRIPFPLFCFVIACNLLRGTPTPRYVQMLLLLGIVTQPIYALALPWDGANVLFTLAAGVCVTEVLRRQRARTQHIIFAIGVAVTFAFPKLTKTGWEFGIDGVLFPAAILLVLAGRREHIVWLSALVIGQNWYGEISPGEPWVLDALIDAAYAGIGSLVILSIALLLRNHDRFLPRYAFHIFYPGHLAVLAMLWQVALIHSH